MQSPVVQKVELPELTEIHQASSTPLDLPLPFLGGMKVNVAVRVGSTSITIAELQALKSKEVIKLDNLLGDPVDVLVEGHLVARGTLVAAGDNFGVQIAEILLPNKSAGKTV